MGSHRGLMLGVNVESKTRCADLQIIARLAAALGARYEGRLEQVDTYFRVQDGRLKLREISYRTPDHRVSSSSELIRYERPDESGARVSTYERTEIGDVESCRTRLDAAHGVRGQVKKQRELWILDSTRIHLDSVEGLGDFVELETVCAGTPGPADRLEHDRLSSALGLDPCATVEGSYIDLADGWSGIGAQRGGGHDKAGQRTHSSCRLVSPCDEGGWRSGAVSWPSSVPP